MGSEAGVTKVTGGGEGASKTILPSQLPCQRNATLCQPLWAHLVAIKLPKS